MGKTSFALNLTANAAFQSRRPVLFFSLEMGNLELTQRLLCAEAQIDSTKVRDGRLQDAEWDRIALGVSRLAERSEEHTSELQSLMRTSYAVFCLKTKKNTEHKDIQSSNN